ncbi:MAG: hydrogenase expression/formation protein HypE [Sulfurovaceae bacterium]|nr:hydrogenase expression/formation protein HypE [Sulfurovaceae bacterium]
MKIKNISLAHGNGGSESKELVEGLFYSVFSNKILNKSEDAALIENGKLAFTTDSFTVNPLSFAGGDIGKLAICGTCNDLAVMGAKPKYLSIAFMIEEGFSFDELKSIIKSMHDELEKNDAIIVCGDTKVVPKGNVDKLFINTTGIGEIYYSGISASNLKEGMSILISRDIGAHGAVVFAAREGMELSTELKSDCASLYPQVKSIVDGGVNIVAMRDATRGGIAAVLNEWANASGITIEIDESKISISQEVQGICELLGFEATALANEGTFVLAVPSEDAQKALAILRQTHESSAIIGSVNSTYKGKVVLKSSWGTQRFLDLPTGELLPRIC